MTKQDGGMPGFDNWIVLLCDGATTAVSIPSSLHVYFTFGLVVVSTVADVGDVTDNVYIT